ncbi:MAG TPA: WG repeat-containing protein, partial [Mucilaginibacter sp.]|nr:WG repeat-containing protein [Mucilaginibacter sp.]
MKTKPLLITIAVLALLAGAFIFIKKWEQAKPQKNEVYQFLVSFNDQLLSGNTDGLMSYFETNKKKDVLMRLLGILSNKTGLKDDKPPVVKLTLNIDQSQIRILNNGLAVAVIPVHFANDSVSPKMSSLKLKIRKVGANRYKIIQADANKLVSDYLAFGGLIRSKMVPDTNLYSQITLKAFETSNQLKSKYDTVVWFAHIGDQTFYYVVKGEWNQDLVPFHFKDTLVRPYKMGLVGPDLKEIIPPDYDLIHNIGGTFPGLVEVEKGLKKGFYDLSGKIVLPVNYDQIFPVDDRDDLAILRNGDDYFYLKKNMTVSGKADLKVSDFFPKIRKMNDSLNLYKNALSVITEYNSHELQAAIYITPSYLVDLGMANQVEDFKNPLRKVDYDEVSENYNIGFSNTVNDDKNWLQASFYSIRDYFLGGRQEFYDKKDIVIIDKKRNKVYAQNIETDYSRDEDGYMPEGTACDISSIKAVNDSLYEVKATAVFSAWLYDSTKFVVEGPYYHYLAIKNNNMVELRDNRYFGFTKYMKLDDSYLNGCYVIDTGATPDFHRKQQIVNRITPEMLRYMKNEIYADYAYKFKD